MDFPALKGGNLPAVAGCLYNVVTYDDGTTRDATGFVLVLEHVDTLADRLPDLATGLLQAFASEAYQGLLIGHRMLCLVQSEDPDLDLPPVLEVSATWNPAEWDTTARRD